MRTKARSDDPQDVLKRGKRSQLWNSTQFLCVVGMYIEWYVRDILAGCLMISIFGLNGSYKLILNILNWSVGSQCPADVVLIQSVL